MAFFDMGCPLGLLTTRSDKKHFEPFFKRNHPPIEGFACPSPSIGFFLEASFFHVPFALKSSSGNHEWLFLAPWADDRVLRTANRDQASCRGGHTLQRQTIQLKYPI
jgi:hypothetical protein